MQLTSFGLWISSRGLDEDRRADAAQLAEQLGFGALWLGGSPPLADLRPLLAATERLVVATGILNVWDNEPAAVAAEHARLTQDFPGRVLLGIGIGHREATPAYANPLATIAGFLDGLEGAAAPVPREQRCLAALGPRMLDLCARRSLGAHPYLVPVSHTRAARARLGPAPLLAPELTCVLDGDPARARASAIAFATRYFGMSNYASNLRRFGFTDREMADASPALIDAIVAQGSAAAVAAVAREHLDAGANHVCLQAVGVGGVPRAEWTALAGELLG